MSKFFVDWFSQQEEFTTDIEEMNKEELNKCLRKFYMSARKQDGGYYNKATLTSIRAAIHRHLRNEPHNKPFSIISDSQFTEANKALNSFLKTLSKSGQICSTVHKPTLTTEAVSKLYEAGELVDARCLDPQKLQQTAWFFITLYFGRRGRENQRQLTKSSLKLSKTPNSGLEYFELNRETPGGVFSTKNHQGGLDGTDDPSDGKMFEGKGLANCPVAVVKAYLSHLNPKCEALFQKPLTGAKFKPSSDVIWYSTLPLGHNTIDSMMKNMCLRAGIDPPFTNHCVRSTTVNILSSKDMKNRHIRAVTGHKSDASLESYNDRPTFEQFKNMSSAITDFINFCRPDHQVAINPLAEVNRSPLETVSEAIHSSTSTNVQENIFVQEKMSTNAAHGIISGGSFSNCSFNFHFK